VTRRDTWMLIGGALISVLLLALSLRGTSAEALSSAIVGLDWRYAPPFLAALFAFYWLKSVRWRTLLRPLLEVRAATLFPVVMMGYAANAVLPAQLGEVVRAYLASRRVPLAFSASLASIVLERVFDFFVVLLVLAVALVSGRAVPEGLETAGYVTAALLGAVLAGVLGLVFFPSRAARLAEAALAWAPRGVGARVSGQVTVAASGFQALREPRLLAAILTVSLVKWGCMLACVALSVLAAGIATSLPVLLLLLALTVLGVSLPTAPGYVGSIQLAYALALVPAGVDPSVAFAASFFYHALAYVSVVVAGCVFLRRDGLGFRRLRAETGSAV
jgi:uncharacterized protein (TIRG00374 family)